MAAHVALNAEGFTTAAFAVRNGAAAFMYPAGINARERDIEALATARWTEIIDRLIAANQHFVQSWCSAPLTGMCATAPGHPWFPAASVPERRRRELQVHLVDLALPEFGVDRWSDSFVDGDLTLQWPTVEHRTDAAIAVEDETGSLWRSGADSQTAPTITRTRRELLAWVLDRSTPPGLPPLAPWSNRSRWEHLATE